MLAVLIGLSPAAARPPADEAPRRAALRAGLRFSDPGGAMLDKISPGKPFRVELVLTSLTGALPRGIQPMAWLRPVALSDLPCPETAAAFRATGRGSAGPVDLNGLLPGVLTEDDALTMLDPECNLGTANLIAAARFDEHPAAMIADAETGRFVVSLPPMGDAVVLASGLDGPQARAPHPSGGGAG